MAGSNLLSKAMHNTRSDPNFNEPHLRQEPVYPNDAALSPANSHGRPQMTVSVDKVDK